MLFLPSKLKMARHTNTALSNTIEITAAMGQLKTTEDCCQISRGKYTRRLPPMMVCEMKAVVELAKTSVQPAIRPGKLKGKITLNSVRHLEAPKMLDASKRFLSSLDSDANV